MPKFKCNNANKNGSMPKLKCHNAVKTDPYKKIRSIKNIKIRLIRDS